LRSKSAFEKKLIFVLLQIIIILLLLLLFMILDHFDVLISKLNFKKWQKIILMYFQAKNTLNSNYHHNPKHYRKLLSQHIFFLGNLGFFFSLLQEENK
jgi:uncharacterized membrane protein